MLHHYFLLSGLSTPARGVLCEGRDGAVPVCLVLCFQALACRRCQIVSVDGRDGEKCSVALIPGRCFPGSGLASQVPEAAESMPRPPALPLLGAVRAPTLLLGGWTTSSAALLYTCSATQS